LNGETGEVLAEGETLKRPAYAKTLRDIAQYGVEAFYNGTIGDKTVEDIRKRGGIITKQDLSQYRHVH
jgi:gamma-glutamyltranspeptidase/glutathione hydrolase/leukotriene-C4 hydrolase